MERVRWLTSKSQRGPVIGPCRDPLHLWYLEWTDDRGTWRHYFENRQVARMALRVFKADGELGLRRLHVSMTASGVLE